MLHHTHIVAEEASGRPFERITTDWSQYQAARQVIARWGGRIIRHTTCRKPITECRKPENLIGGNPRGWDVVDTSTI